MRPMFPKEPIVRDLNKFEKAYEAIREGRQQLRKLAGIQRVMREVVQHEHDELMRWNKLPRDEVHLPWMPFQPAEFIAMLAEAVAETKGGNFLDVGCGIGTKLRLAAEIFGLSAHGVEYDTGMCLLAASQKLDVSNTDALDYDLYGDYDIVWMYRPFRDPERQAWLELKIRSEMKRGALFMFAAAETPPPPDWIPVLDDWEVVRRGIYQKP